MSKKTYQFPTRKALLDYIKAQPEPPSKRDIAKAFGVRGDDRVILKDMLREMKKSGELPDKRAKPPTSKGSGKNSAGIVVMEVSGFNSSGILMVRPVHPTTHEPDEQAGEYELAYRDEAPFPGDRILAQTDIHNPDNRRAVFLRILPEQLTHVLGIYHGEGEHGRIEPVNRKIKEDFSVARELAKGAKDGELVYCRLVEAGFAPRRHSRRQMLRPVEVIERIGRLDNPRSASLIAIQNQNIPMEFSAEAIRIAESAQPPILTAEREDLRAIPLVTIDGADARDFDDAVWAEPDGDGWHLIVAIADVAHYVRFGSALDNEAFQRGNSVYFPDRVVPMLPEALSNGLCSLVPHEDRYCLAVHLWIDARGNTQKYRFVRGIMRSHARLTYEQIQAAYDGEPQQVDEAILASTIRPLYGVYQALNSNRLIRGALELDLPEHQVEIDEVTGRITNIRLRERYDSHKLIEECMIAANVAAAHAIETANAPGMFRVHEEPDLERVTDLRGFLQQMGYAIAHQERLSAHHFNAVLREVQDKPEAHVIHMAILRSQMAAYYHPKNLGHFGLSLEQYCHYTSPIRRYSDLIVHRTLIDIFDLCDRETDGLVYEQAQNLGSIATHISQTERRAMLAEREARERYITNFMADRVGKEFDAIIAGVNSFGFFAELRENGAQGLVPARSIGGDYWIYDKEHQRLIGRSTGETFQLGQWVRVELLEADTLTGSLRFGLVGREVRTRPASRGYGRGRPYGGNNSRRPDKPNAPEEQNTPPRTKEKTTKASGYGKRAKLARTDDTSSPRDHSKAKNGTAARKKSGKYRGGKKPRR